MLHIYVEFFVRKINQEMEFVAGLDSLCMYLLLYIVTGRIIVFFNVDDIGWFRLSQLSILLSFQK